MTRYGFGKTVDMSFDDAIVHVTQAPQDVGFGILDDIDVSGAMKKKLNQDMPPSGSWARAIHPWRTAAWKRMKVAPAPARRTSTKAL